MVRYHTAEEQRAYLDKKREESGLKVIQCLICKRKFRQVGSHVVQIHGYETARQYREEFGLDVKRGLLPEDLRRKKARQAIDGGGVKNLEKGAEYRFTKKDPRAGRYKRSKQTMDRLRRRK